MTFKILHKLYNNPFKFEQGQGSVIIVISLLGLISVTALIVDSGRLMVQRRLTQNAADAASLAGAIELSQASTDSEIYYAIQQYAKTLNRATSVSAAYYPGGETVGSGTVPADAEAVIVETTITSPTIFAGMLGINEFITHASSTGGFSPGGPVSEMTAGVYPIAVNWQNFQYGQTYNIFAGTGPGNFGWLTWQGSTSTPTLCTSLTPPGNSETFINPNDSNDHSLSIGDWVQGSTGTMNASCVRNHLDYFIDNETPITIVVWDSANSAGGSNANYHIAGFATFIVEDYHLPHNRITGHFIEWTIPNAVTDPAAPNYGTIGPGQVIITE